MTLAKLRTLSPSKSSPFSIHLFFNWIYFFIISSVFVFVFVPSFFIFLFCFFFFFFLVFCEKKKEGRKDNEGEMKWNETKLISLKWKKIMKERNTIMKEVHVEFYLLILAFTSFFYAFFFSPAFKINYFLLISFFLFCLKALGFSPM